MEFLDERYKSMDILLLNIYYDRGTWSNPDDVLYVLFKEIETEKKRIVEITAPDIEVHLLKKEYRENPSLINYDPRFLHDWIDKAHCDTYRVNYKNRWKEIGELLGITADEAKRSPYVFGADMDIEVWYIHQFINEYGTPKKYDVSAGFFDIETDTINFTGWPETGEAPISCVTYIDGPGKTVYTLVYHNCGIKPNHPRYAELSERYNRDYEETMNHLDEFIEELHQDFDASYGELEYIILSFDSEIEMLKVLFSIINECGNDFNGAWNAPFDFGNLMVRPHMLGFDPIGVIADEDFKYPLISFKEDQSFNAVKRKHTMFSPNKCVWTDAMVNYAAIRSQKGKLPSNRLNYVAQVELKDTKLDFSEETDIKHFMYENFRKFLKYNIKDTLLLLGLENKNRDLLDVVSRISTLGVPPNKVFASLAMEDSAIIHYMDRYKRNGQGYWPGPNRSKLGITNQSLNDQDAEVVDDEDMDAEGLEDYGDIFSSGDDDEKDGVDYEGAIVLHPAHMTPSGHKINGDDKKFIHDNMIDEDITAEYPTATILMNAANETLHGKIVFEDKIKKEIPIYTNFEFADAKEAKDYSINNETFIMECYQQGQYGIIGEFLLGLPGADELIEIAKKEGADLYE